MNRLVRNYIQSNVLSFRVIFLSLVVSLTSACGDSNPLEKDEETAEVTVEPVTFPAGEECTVFGSGTMSIILERDDEIQTLDYRCQLTPSVNDKKQLYFQFYDRYDTTVELQNNVTFSLLINTIEAPGEFPMGHTATVGKSYFGISTRSVLGEAYDSLYGPENCSLDCGKVVVEEYTAPPNGTVSGEFSNIRVANDDDVEFVINGTFSVEALQ